MLGFNLQNYYAPKLNELPDTSSNALLLRIVSPFWRILPRITLPVVATQNPESSATGLGDLNAFITFLVTDPDASFQFGFGPQYTAPTATDPSLGAEKHSVGGAMVAVWSHKSLMLGSLITAQGAVAGNDDRADPVTLAAQIFAIFQLGQGYYLRSTPVATFQLESGDYNVPFGLGAGKVIVLDRTVFNLFLEPQWTFLVEGAGQPMFQVFSGINVQYKL